MVVVTYCLFIDQSLAFSFNKIGVMFFKFFNFNVGIIHSTNAKLNSIILKNILTQLLNFSFAFWKFNQRRSKVLDSFM